MAKATWWIVLPATVGQTLVLCQLQSPFHSPTSRRGSNFSDFDSNVTVLRSDDDEGSGAGAPNKRSVAVDRSFEILQKASGSAVAIIIMMHLYWLSHFFLTTVSFSHSHFVAVYLSLTVYLESLGLSHWLCISTAGRF